MKNLHIASKPHLRPPGPKERFGLGHYLEFVRDPRGFLQQSARLYGDIVAIHPPVGRAYLINHPDLIEELLITRQTNFVKFKAYRLFSDILGEGLLLSEGEVWQRQRRLAQPAFQRNHLGHAADATLKYTELLLAEWRNGQTRDIYSDMLGLVLKITAKVLFDVDVSSEADATGQAFEVALQILQNRLSTPLQLPQSWPLPANRRYQEAIAHLDRVIYSIIEQRQNSANYGEDLLSLYLQAKDAPEAGNSYRMSRRQLRDEMLTLFFAGYETTCITLAWVFYLLARHPQFEQTWRNELQTVLAADSHSDIATVKASEGTFPWTTLRLPNQSDLHHLYHTEALIKETLRLYPPVWMSGREAISEDEIGGYPIESGQQVWFSPWVIQRDPRFYPLPEEFHPERWFISSPAHHPADFDNGLTTVSGHKPASVVSPVFTTLPSKYTYLPFSVGPRYCIGSNLALMEIALIVATVGSRYRLTLEQNQGEVYPGGLTTLRPRGGLKMVVNSLD